MANIKSAIRRIKITIRNHNRNQAAQSDLKTKVKTARKATAKTGAPLFVTAQKTLAKAASKGIIHKKQAARRTSRLARALAKAK